MNLKPYCFLFLILFAMSSVVRSQNKEFIVGAVIGFYGIEIKGDIKNMYSPTHGKVWGTGALSAGLNVKHNFSKIIYGALEIRYIHKGSIYEFISNEGSRAFESIRLNYFEIPVSIGFTIKLKKKHLLIETGFAYARMFSSKMLLSSLNPWDYSSKLKNFKKDDISWTAGIKYPIIKSEKLLLGIRFSYSLFSIHSLYKLRNMDYGIEFYYLFNRNKA
jgi:hypothetical protein